MMMTGGVRRRSWLAVAAVLGLVGSLLAVGVVRPVGAVSGEADREALFSACVGPALESRGLVDVVGSFAEDAVNCLGHFGVTQGRTETTYDPGAPVLRWQMALFLSRAAVPAGVSLPADTSDVELTDLGDVSEGTRTAVLQMAKLGIMPGFGGLFYPERNVTRANMAEMLDAFLDKAQVGTGAFGGEVFELGDVSPDDEVFGDIDQVTRGEYSAIRRMFEVGVARGTSDDAFSPGGLVTRAQMAVFITRMLAHTAARPVGLTLQVSKDAVTTGESVDAAVSVRGSDLMALPDQKIDVFSSTDPGNAFGEDGRCVSDSVKAETHSSACEIVFSDESTDPSGDWSGTVNLEDDSATIWAWSGDVGDVFDADDVSAPSVEVAVSKPGVKLKVSDDLPANASAAKFGASVKFTIQVVDEDGEPVALEGVKFSGSVSEIVDSGAEGVAPTASSTGTSYTTDEAGMVELTFRQNDPRSGTRGDAAWLDLDLWAGRHADFTAAFEIDDKTTLEMVGVEDSRTPEQRDAFAPAPRGDAAVVWEDSVAKASVLKLTQAVEFHEASDTNRGASNTVTATLTDQYGDGVSRQVVEFFSDDEDGIGGQRVVDSKTVGLLFDPASETSRMFTGSSRQSKTTDRRGKAGLSYNRDSSAGGIETIWAMTRLGTTTTDDDVSADRVSHYWAVEPGNGDSASGRVMLADAENNRLILAGPGVSLVAYDNNDQLNSTEGAVLLEDFEKEFGAEADPKAAFVSVSNYQTSAKNVSRFTSMLEPISEVLAYPSADNTDAGRVDGGMLRATAGEARYGSSFSVGSGVIVVGSPGEPSGDSGEAENAGRVYIYEGSNDDAPQVVRQAGDTDSLIEGTLLGQTVALTDDGNALAVNKIVAQFTDFFIWTRPAGDSWKDTEGGGGANADDRHTGWGPSPNYPGGSFGEAAHSSQGHADRMFTDSIVFSGDGRTMVVGAPGDDKAGAANTGTPGSGWAKGGTGLVFVYTMHANQTRWDQPQGDSAIDMWTTGASGTVNILVPAEPGSGNAELQVDDFGGNNAIAVSEDGSVIAVGVSGADFGGEDAGAVYVYVRKPFADRGRLNNIDWRGGDGSGWQRPLAKLTGNAGEMLGASVDISADGKTLAASAPGAGSVYVFEAQGTAANGYWDVSPDSSTLSNSAGSDFAAGDPMRRNTVAVRADGSEIAVGNGGRADGDWRGSVAVYARPSGGDWDDMADPSMEYLGTAANQRLGWSVAYDQSNGTIYASGFKPVYIDVDRDDDNDPDTPDVTVRELDEQVYTIYRLDRS